MDTPASRATARSAAAKKGAATRRSQQNARRRFRDSELADALASYATTPCATCGQPLGPAWREVYREDTERLVKVHVTDCS
jgi:hypothetical protein